MDAMGVVLGPMLTTPILFTALTGVLTLVIICFFTRFTTGSAFEQDPAKREPRKISVIPYWIPWFGHTLSFAMGGQDFLSRSSREYHRTAFSILLRGRQYAIITAPSLVTQLEDTDVLEMSTETRQYKLRHFFGNRSSGSSLDQTVACHDNDRNMLKGSGGVSRTQGHMKNLVGALEHTAYNLVSFNESWIDQSNWERRSKTVVLTESSTVAEVSFFPLVDSYIGELSTTALLGRNFLENNPGFLDDFRLWDSKAISFMNQTPLFLPQMSGAAAARDRVLRAFRRFRGVLSIHNEDDDPGSDWSDLSDVSPLFTERMLHRNDKTKSSPAKPDVAVDAAFLWAFHKPNSFIAWLLYRVYSDTSLLAEVRKDIKPFVHVEYLKSELPIFEPPRVKIDSEGLVKKSKLLREVMNETIRLHTNTITYGVATKDLILIESQEDATNLSKDKPDSYILRKDEQVCVAHGTAEMSQGSFNPAGFNSLANLKAPRAAGKSHASHAFGVGRVTCPGRGLAEQEILIVVATILSMWEVDYKWHWPGQQMGLCSTTPVEDVRVRILRRKVGESVD